MAGLLANHGLFGGTAGPGGPLFFQLGLGDAGRLNGDLVAVAKLRDLLRGQAVAGLTAAVSAVVGRAAPSTAQRDVTARAHAGEAAVLEDSRRILAVGRAILDTAEEAFPRLESALAELRALAVKGQDPDLTTKDRTDLANRVAAINAEIDTLATKTKFGETPLLDGSLETSPIRLNPGVAGSRVDDLSIRLGGTRASDLGVASLDLSSKAAADAAVATAGTLDSADKTLAALKGRITALRERLADVEGRLGGRQEFHRTNRQGLLEAAAPAPHARPRFQEVRDRLANPQAQRATQEENAGQARERFLRDNADLVRLIDANPSARAALAGAEVRTRDDLRAVLIRGVTSALGASSPITGKLLEERFDVARFLALDPGRIASAVRDDRDLARAVAGEVGLVEALGRLADQRIGELLPRTGPGRAPVASTAGDRAAKGAPIGGTVTEAEPGAAAPATPAVITAAASFAPNSGGQLDQSERLRFTVNGGPNQDVNLSAGDTISTAITRINNAVGTQITASNDNGTLKFTSVQAGSGVTITVESNKPTNGRQSGVGNSQLSATGSGGSPTPAVFDAGAFAPSTPNTKLGQSETLTFIINGAPQTLSLAANSSITNVVDAINSSAVGSSITASNNNGALRFTAVANTTFFTVLSNRAPDGTTTGVQRDPSIRRLDAPLAFAASSGGTLAQAETLTFNINGVNTQVSLAAGDSISAAVTKINDAVGTSVTASNNGGTLRVEAIQATTSFSITSSRIPDGTTSGVPHPTPFTRSPAGAGAADRNAILDRAVALLDDPVRFGRDFLEAHFDFARAVVGSDLQGGPVSLAEFSRQHKDLIGASGSTDRLAEAFEVRVAAETFGRRVGLGEETFRANPGLARLVNRAPADVLQPLVADGDRLRALLRNEPPRGELRLGHPDLFRDRVRPPADAAPAAGAVRAAIPSLRPAFQPLTQPSPAGLQINLLA
jgi:hypothetical protein